MKIIFDFLNNTTLTAGQQIVLAVITTCVVFLITFFMKKMKGILNSAINSLWGERIKEKKRRTEICKRYKHGKLTIGDSKYLMNMVKEGRKLSPIEKKALDKLLAQEKQFQQEFAEVFKDFQLPDISRIK